MTDPEAYWESNEDEAAADAAARGKIMTLDDARADLDVMRYGEASAQKALDGGTDEDRAAGAESRP